MPQHRTSDGPAHHEPGARAGYRSGTGLVGEQGMHGQQRPGCATATAYDVTKIARAVQAEVAGQQRRGLHRVWVGLSRQLVAALTAAPGEDGATGAGTHPQPEAVGLGATAVVRLEGALAHDGARSRVDGLPAPHGRHQGVHAARRVEGRADGRRAQTSPRYGWPPGGSNAAIATRRAATGRAGAVSAPCLPLVGAAVSVPAPDLPRERRSASSAGAAPRLLLSGRLHGLRDGSGRPAPLSHCRLHRLWTDMWTSRRSSGRVSVGGPLVGPTHDGPAGSSARRVEGHA